MNDLKKHLVLYISIVVVLICIVFTASYAYFIANIRNNGKETNVVAGAIDLDFTTSNYINLESMNLIEAEDVDSKAPHTDFKVKHKATSNVDLKYQLYLTDVKISDNFKSKYLKWQLLKEGKELYSGDFQNTISDQDMLLTTNPQDLTVSQTNGDSYVLRIWLENDPNVNQIDLTNGELTAKVKVVARIRE